MMKKFKDILKENCLFDSHAHLDLSDRLINEKLDRAKKAGVTYVINMGTKPADWIDVLNLSKNQQTSMLIFPCLGIHPEEVDAVGEAEIAELKNLVTKNHDELLMIGEIGLDYYWRQDNKEKQNKLFIAQLEIAKKYNMPVSVHVRAAYDDALAVLQEQKLSSEIILHSFTGTYNDLKIAIDRGYYLGVNGIITYSGAKELKATFKKYLGTMKDAEPRDFYKKHILFETDSPLLRPSNASTPGKENEPANTAMIFEFVKKMVRV